MKTEVNEERLVDLIIAVEKEFRCSLCPHNGGCSHKDCGEELIKWLKST